MQISFYIWNFLCTLQLEHIHCFLLHGHWFITCLCTSFQTASSKSLGKKWHTQSFKVTISIIYYMDYKTFHLEESFILLIFIITFFLYVYIKISDCIHFFHPLQISNSYNTACVFNVSQSEKEIWSCCLLMGWFAKVTTQIATIIINNNHHNSLQLKILP